MLFIDTSTGTWGNAEDIVFLHDDFADELEDMSDSEIIELGNAWGDAPLLPNTF